MKNQSFQTVDLSIDKIVTEKGFNARKDFNQSDLKELAESIESQGILQPLVVRPTNGNGSYHLVIGERRLRASRLAKLKTVPCIVRELSDSQAIAAMAIENLQRKDLTPLEEAEGIDRLLKTGISAEEAAHEVGRPISFIRKRNTLNFLFPEWKKVLSHQGINLTMGDRLARLPNDMQEKIKDHVDQNSWSYSEDESGNRYYNLNNLSHTIDSIHRDLSEAPWDMEDDQLVKKAGACSSCTKRSICNLDLFEDLENRENTCLDFECYRMKRDAFLDLKLEKAKEKNGGEEPVLINESYFSDDENVLSKSDYNIVKKSEPGAKLAMYLDGKKAGKTAYVSVVYRSGSGPMTEEQKAERKKVIRENKIEKLSKSLAVTTLADEFQSQLGRRGPAVEKILNYWIADILGYGQSKEFIQYFMDRYSWKHEVDYHDSMNRREVIARNIEETPMKLKFRLLIETHFKMATVSEYDSSSINLVKQIDSLDLSELRKEAEKIVDTPKVRKSNNSKNSKSVK